MKKVYFLFVSVFLIALLSSSRNAFTPAKTTLFLTDSLILDPNLGSYEYHLDSVSAMVTDFIGSWGNGANAELPFVSNEGAALGRVLFYDKRLSADGKLSCASCHKQEFAFADNVAQSEGAMGQLTRRNSPNLNDLAWQAHDKLFWDAQPMSLEELILLPLQAQDELGADMPELIRRLENTNYYPDLFLKAFGPPATGQKVISQYRITKAMAMFINSMVSTGSKFDEVMLSGTFTQNFTPEEMDGFWHFLIDCSSCHNLNHLGMQQAFHNGLDSVLTDLGVGEWNPNVGHRGKFRSPTLRNIEYTAPYMHDGRFETLEEVIDFYSTGIQPHPNSSFNGPPNVEDFTGFKYDEEAKANLKAFLLTLSDPHFISDPKWSDPFMMTTSAPGPAFLEGVSLFPNPMTDQSYLTVPQDGKRYEIRLSDSYGRLLWQHSLEGGQQFEIKRRGEAAGVYFVEVTNGSAKRILRLLMQ